MSVFPLRRWRAKAETPPPDLPPVDLVAALPLPVVVLDADGRVALANTAAEAFLNVSQASLQERGLAAGLAADASLAGLIDGARAGANDITVYDSAIALAGGRTVRADVFVTHLTDAPGWTMVSLQPRPAAALAERRAAGQGAARSATGVAAMLAHEIKNPLSGIRGAAQLLGATVDDDARELTTLICDEVDRVAALIDRMEGFTDTRPSPKRAENIHAVLGRVRALAASGFAQDVPIRERYDPSLPPVAGNHDALVQVFLNLIKNAAEAVVAAGGAGGEITLTTAYRHGFSVSAADGRRVALPLEVCVVDTGFGPSPEVAGHMFEPFVSSKRAGGGLGLALVAKIIGDHGGIVEHERASDPPRTIFRVLLPTA